MERNVPQPRRCVYDQYDLFIADHYIRIRVMPGQNDNRDIIMFLIIAAAGLAVVRLFMPFLAPFNGI
ncbi:MAG: hypothetical protein GC131_05135 [Alphaproteobacteria bacterium]|nr:hypothetical protein [Alphaproteobacteria bacterium]